MCASAIELWPNEQLFKENLGWGYPVSPTSFSMNSQPKHLLLSKEERLSTFWSFHNSEDGTINQMPISHIQPSFHLKPGFFFTFITELSFAAVHFIYQSQAISKDLTHSRCWTATCNKRIWLLFIFYRTLRWYDRPNFVFPPILLFFMHASVET